MQAIPNGHFLLTDFFVGLPFDKMHKTPLAILEISKYIERVLRKAARLNVKTKQGRS